MFCALALASVSHSTEGAGGLYVLGSQALGAGLAPAPGWYVSSAVVHYSGQVGAASVGGVTLIYLKKRVDSMGINLLYAPSRRVFGAQAAVSLTLPYAYLSLTGETEGRITGVHAVSNAAFGDAAVTGRLGWRANHAFSHALSLTVWFPTGGYQRGFNASIGHNRWACDALWSMTYVSMHNHLELSAAIGVGINGINPMTRYRSGDEAHLELAVGKRLSSRWAVGIAGYAYQQVTGDSGAGDRLGALRGRVLGVGPAVNYGARMEKHAIAIGARYYREFDANDHFHGDVFILSTTLSL